MNNTKKEVPIELLEKLYSELTKMSLKELETMKDKFPPTATVILPEKILIPLLIGPEKDKFETLVNILKTGRVSAVITIAKGWAVKTNKDEPISFSLKRHPRSDEIFFAAIESVEMTMTKAWKIKRDKQGEMIFPLGNPEVFLEDEAFKLIFVVNYHSAGNGHEN
jgi:hypothetical protein